MVSLARDPQTVITTDTYRLVFPSDERPYVYLEDLSGKRLADLCVMTGVNSAAGQDDTTELGVWQVTEEESEIICSIEAKSSVWKSKTFRFRCQSRRILYEVEVEGSGALSDVQYFGGYYSYSLRWGSGFFWSGMKAIEGFNPEPNCDEKWTFAPDVTSVIDMTGVPIPGRGDWFFTPPPFCFAFAAEHGWFGMGVEAKPGANRYTEFRYHGQQFGFYLALAFDGYTEVNGVYTLPTIVFDFAEDPYRVLERHVAGLVDQGLVRGHTPISTPEWWHEPIFCGWGHQCYLAASDGGKHAPDYARQPLYEEAMRTLDAVDIRPGIVVLDDKWQKTYGSNEVDFDKWPDIRRFSDFLHGRGQKMLLWLKAWDPEGLPIEECICNAAGHKVSVDPTNPKYEARLRASVRRMLSSDGYDADGFKIDFTARVPSGPSFSKTGDIWGLELMKQFLFLLYDETKKVKPDAIVMAHTPHPYLADVVDMIRLNDVNVATDINKAMIHRARVARIACPQAVIDTDNWPMPNREAWRQYVALQPQLGVPSLYYVSHVDATQEPLMESDYQLIRDSWRLAKEGRKRTEIH